MSPFVRVALGILLCYGLYCLALFIFQRILIFPRYAIPVTRENRVAKPEKWWLETGFGTVEAWFIPPILEMPASPAPAVLFAHGNAELIDFWPDQLRGFISMGVGVLLVEYPGYGRSEGSPSQEHITEALIAGYDRLVLRSDVDSQRIVLFGRSLGGGAVCALAEERPSAALILMSTFKSIRSLSWRFMAPPFLVRDPFDNMRLVKKYESPLLVIHGRFDTLVPYSHGISLARAAKRSKMITYNCQHNDCPPSWPMFWRDVALFFEETGLVQR